MVVGFDVRSAVTRRTGVGRYLCGLLPALVQQGVRVVGLSSSLRDRVDPRLFPGVELYDRRIPVRLLDWSWRRLGAPDFRRLAAPVDICHSATPLPLPAAGTIRVVTLHDLYFLRTPEGVRGTEASSWRDRVRAAALAADAIVCVSRSTAAQAARLLDLPEHRLAVIHHGLEERWFDPIPAATVRRVCTELAAGQRFLLAVGALEVRKNYLRLISAFDRLRRSGVGDLRLVIAGPDGQDGSRLRAMVSNLGLSEAVRWVGFQDDATLAALYRGALAYVMPSIDEGFGFPVLEAMACDCPVVAAATGALPEIAGDGALYVDPTDEESLLEGLRRIVDDDAERQRLIELGAKQARGFRWATSARRTADVYATALAARA